MNTKLLFVMLVALSFSTLAQDKKYFWDGADWNKIDRITREYPEYNYWIKSAYLSGLLDGKFYYQLRVRETISVAVDTLFDDLIEAGDLRPMIAGLDAFYRDPAHRYIPIPNALIATNLIQAGQPQEVIESYIKESKTWINRLDNQQIGW